MSARKSTASDAPGARLSAGILLLPSKSRESEETIAGEVRKLWSCVGGVDIESRRTGGGRRELGAVLREWSAEGGKDIVLTIGLCGHRRDDIAPDVTEGLLERRLPGVEEAISLPPRRLPEDLLFRGRAGIRGRTIIVNLPARRAARRNGLRILAPVLVHAVEKIGGDETECGAE